MSNKETLEIIQGISQALTNKFHGALDEEGKPVEIGLRREENKDFRQRPTLDGFGVSIQGRTLRLTYESEIALKEVHQKGFEKNIIGIMDDCLSFLKKEYKKITNKNLSLKMIGEPILNVEHINNHRNVVVGYCLYEISGIAKEKPQERLDSSFKKWLELGGHK